MSAKRPDPSWVRGRCPKCRDELVSHLYYCRGVGYIIKWECWSSKSDTPTCDYSLKL